MREEYFYIAVVHGVYRHNILGLSNHKDKAFLLAYKFLKSERDAWHEVQIIRRRKNTYNPEMKDRGWIMRKILDEAGKPTFVTKKFGEVTFR